MNESRRLSWIGAGTFFLAGCTVAFLALRHWHGAGASVAPIAEQTNNYWRFETELKPARSVLVSDPDKTGILSFVFGSLKGAPIPYPVTIKNLANHPLSVTYQVFAYDAGKRRVGQATDSVIIGTRETVLRQLYFSDSLSPYTPTYVSFRLVANIRR